LSVTEAPEYCRDLINNVINYCASSCAMGKLSVYNQIV